MMLWSGLLVMLTTLVFETNERKRRRLMLYSSRVLCTDKVYFLMLAKAKEQRFKGP